MHVQNGFHSTHLLSKIGKTNKTLGNNLSIICISSGWTQKDEARWCSTTIAWCATSSQSGVKPIYSGRGLHKWPRGTGYLSTTQNFFDIRIHHIFLKKNKEMGIFGNFVKKSIFEEKKNSPWILGLTPVSRWVALLDLDELIIPSKEPDHLVSSQTIISFGYQH